MVSLFAQRLSLSFLYPQDYDNNMNFFSVRYVPTFVIILTSEFVIIAEYSEDGKQELDSLSR